MTLDDVAANFHAMAPSAPSPDTMTLDDIADGFHRQLNVAHLQSIGGGGVTSPETPNDWKLQAQQDVANKQAGVQFGQLTPGVVGQDEVEWGPQQVAPQTVDFNQRAAIADAYRRQWAGGSDAASMPTEGEVAGQNMQALYQKQLQQQVQNQSGFRNFANAAMDAPPQVVMGVAQLVHPTQAMANRRADVGDVLASDPNSIATKAGSLAGSAPFFMTPAGIPILATSAAGDFRQNVMQQRVAGAHISGSDEFAGAAGHIANMLLAGSAGKLLAAGMTPALLEEGVIQSLARYSTAAGIGTVDMVAMQAVSNELNRRFAQMNIPYDEGMFEAAVMGGVFGLAHAASDRPPTREEFQQRIAENAAARKAPAARPQEAQARPQPQPTPESPVPPTAPEAQPAAAPAPQEPAYTPEQQQQILARNFPTPEEPAFPAGPHEMQAPEPESQPLRPTQADLEAQRHLAWVRGQMGQEEGTAPEKSLADHQRTLQAIKESVDSGQDLLRAGEDQSGVPLDGETRLRLEKQIQTGQEQIQSGLKEITDQYGPEAAQGVQDRLQQPRERRVVSQPVQEERRLFGRGTHAMEDVGPEAQAAAEQGGAKNVLEGKPPVSEYPRLAVEQPAEPTGQPAPAPKPRPAPKAGRKGIINKSDVERTLVGEWQKQEGHHERQQKINSAMENQATTFYHKDAPRTPTSAMGLKNLALLPGEVRNFLEGRANLRNKFKVTSSATAAGGEDAMAANPHYFEDIQHGGQNKTRAALEWARNHPDPSIKLLSWIHENLPPMAERKAMDQVDPSKQPTGSTFESMGHKFEIVQGAEGHRLLRDGEDFDPLPADQLDKMPIDKGTLKAGTETTARPTEIPGDVTEPAEPAWPPEKPRKQDLFGGTVIDRQGGEQGYMFHEPVEENRPEMERVGSAESNKPEHTAEMFPKEEAPVEPAREPGADETEPAPTEAAPAEDPRAKEIADGITALESQIKGATGKEKAALQDKLEMLKIMQKNLPPTGGEKEGPVPFMPEGGRRAESTEPNAPRGRGNDTEYSDHELQTFLDKVNPGAVIESRKVGKVFRAAADVMGKAFGVDVVHIRGGDAAGFYDRERGIIFIHGGKPIQGWTSVIAHEWMHHVQAVNPELAKKLYDAIPEWAKKKYLRDYVEAMGGQEKFDAYQAEHAAAGGNVAAEEIGAMAMGDAAMRGRVRRALMGQDPTAWEQIQDVFSKMYDKVTGKSPIIDAALKAISEERGNVARGEMVHDMPDAENPFRLTPDNEIPAPIAASPLFAPKPGEPTEKSTWETIGDRARLVMDGLNRLSGKTAPTMTRLAQKSGEALGRYAASITYCLNATPAISRRILGHLEGMEEMNGCSPRKILGALLTQDKLDWIRDKWNTLADEAKTAMKGHPILPGGTDLEAEYRAHADDVHTLIGAPDSPFKTQADFDKALADPKIQAALKEWDTWFKSGPDKDYMTAQKITDPALIESNARGLRTGIQVNMKAIDPEAVSTASSPVNATRGNLTNPRLRGSKFAREAKGTGAAYETDPEALIAHTLHGGYERARLHELYTQMVGDGVAKIGKPGDRLPGYTPLEIESAKRFVNKEPTGETRGFTLPAKMLFVKSEAMPELRNALNVDASHLANSINGYAHPLNIATLASFREAAYHLGNGLTMFSKPGTGAVIDRLATNIWKLATGDQGIRDQIEEISRIGAGRDPHKATWNPLTWTGHVLDAFDRGGRVMLDDAFTSMARKSLVENTETNRRDFINQMGNYNKRSQALLVRAGRETGLAPFATAGTNYLAQAIRMHALSPGVKATSPAAAMRLRAEVALRLALPLIGVGVANYLRWGRVDGGSSVPLGSLRLADDDKGRPRYLDIASLEGVTRALRASGTMPYLDQAIRGNRGAEAADSSAKAILQSAAGPFAGPAVRAASTVASGRDIPGIGRQKALKAEPGESQFAENAKAAAWAANPIAEYLHGLYTGQVETADIGQEAGRFGVKRGYKPEQSNAEAIADKLAAQRYDGSPMSASELAQMKQRQADVQTLKTRDAAGLTDMRKRQAAGQLTDAELARLQKQAAAPNKLTARLEGLPTRSAMQVWDAMSDAEKKQNAALVWSKLKNQKTVTGDELKGMGAKVQADAKRLGITLP